MIELEIKPTGGAKARVASVIVSAVVISAALIYLLTGGGRVLFAVKSTLYTFVPDAAGLTRNSEVRLSGIPIGIVENVRLSGYLDPQRIVKVEMRVDTGYLRNIPSDSQANISADNLVGSQYVSIDEGTSKLPVQPDGILKSEPLKQAVDRADLIKGLSDELGQVDSLLTQMSSSDNPVGAIFNGEEEYDQLLTRLAGFQTALHNFESPESGVGQMLFSDRLYNDLHKYLTRIDDTMASIQRGEGAAGKLFVSDVQYNDFLRELRDLRVSLRRAQPYVNDDSQYRRIQRLLKQTDAAIAAFNAGGGTAGQLIANASLYESLNGSLRSLQELLLDFQEHPQKYLRIDTH
ncbi:MAG: MCE family protein [Acidobacteriota bacterium]|nr:MCE family protein [Acidobacteriota bacterium]